MHTKVIYIPLDERPCNKVFPSKLFGTESFQIISPDEAIYGYKEKPADLEALDLFIQKHATSADSMVISLDFFLYGGLVASRIHEETQEKLVQRMQVLQNIQLQNPKLKIFAFSTIMRVPQYNSLECDMPYLKDYGVSIFTKGYLEHKKKLYLLTEQEQTTLDGLEIPVHYLEDFLRRRKLNLEMILQGISYVETGVFCEFSILQDDSSPYGYTAMDQEKIRERVKESSAKKQILLYPGADEVGMIVMAKLYNQMYHKIPNIYVLYPGPTCKEVIPNIEDRTLDSMVSYHIINAGATRATSIKEADAILYVHAPADKMISVFSKQETSRGIDVLINPAHAFSLLSYYQKEHKKHVFVADVTFGNGSKLEVYHYLSLYDMVHTIDAFAGWNTASNTIGSAVAHGIASMYQDKPLQYFLYERYVEDIGYCGYTRGRLYQDAIFAKEDVKTYDFSGEEEYMKNKLRCALEEFTQKEMKEIVPYITKMDTSFVWNRLYDIALDITLK